MPKFRTFLIAATSLTLLTGCSVFYPNWGAEGLPEEELTSSPATEESPTESDSPEPTQEPTQTAIPKEKVTVEILMAVVEEEIGVLTVVARIPTINESDGKCKVRFLSGNVEETLEVAAEPSAGYTQCYPIELPLADLPSGNGVVTVSYESERHIGESAATSVVIP
ncbi:MAG: hypothetical protein F2536_02790 [Actinobacteria bacterium]|uniref:Unannotated protein n=1 Tax=freshwater metagenome TaxID=449393 RepID=A0A6J6EPP0_9ZZZZ|nr:hypothetical protein [Actinomycetota bacterium]MTA89837.1 hypothetical protein [Actinomycetota bacterium]